MGLLKKNWMQDDMKSIRQSKKDKQDEKKWRRRIKNKPWKQVWVVIHAKFCIGNIISPFLSGVFTYKHVVTFRVTFTELKQKNKSNN